MTIFWTHMQSDYKNCIKNNLIKPYPRPTSQIKVHSSLSHTFCSIWEVFSHVSISYYKNQGEFYLRKSPPTMMRDKFFASSPSEALDYKIQKLRQQWNKKWHRKRSITYLKHDLKMERKNTQWWDKYLQQNFMSRMTGTHWHKKFRARLVASNLFKFCISFVIYVVIRNIFNSPLWFIKSPNIQNFHYEFLFY